MNQAKIIPEEDIKLPSIGVENPCPKEIQNDIDHQAEKCREMLPKISEALNKMVSLLNFDNTKINQVIRVKKRKTDKREPYEIKAEHREELETLFDLCENTSPNEETQISRTTKGSIAGILTDFVITKGLAPKRTEDFLLRNASSYGESLKQTLVLLDNLLRDFSEERNNLMDIFASAMTSIAKMNHELMRENQATFARPSFPKDIPVLPNELDLNTIQTETLSEGIREFYAQ